MKNIIITHETKDKLGVKSYTDGKNSYYLNNICSIQNPTGNCQLCCIKNMNEVLSLNKVGDRLKVLKTIYETHLKPLALVDIREDYKERLNNTNKKLNNKLIKVKCPYGNSNGSSMILAILDLTCLKNIKI